MRTHQASYESPLNQSLRLANDKTLLHRAKSQLHKPLSSLTVLHDSVCEKNDHIILIMWPPLNLIYLLNVRKSKQIDGNQYCIYDED